MNSLSFIFQSRNIAQKSAPHIGIWELFLTALSHHILNVSRGAFLELRRIRNFLTIDAIKTLVCSPVLPRIDYCNSLLAGLPQCLLKKIQYVQNAAAKIIFWAPKADHVSSLLQKLHWLPICCRIEHKISLLCYSSLSGTEPKYLSDQSVCIF